LNPSENPVVASSLIDFNQNIQENQQYQVNISSAQAKLQLESSTLSSATDVLQSVRELTVQGLNGSNTAANRQQIATQINQLNQQLMTLANTQDANGQYLFSGSATSTQPFVSTPAYAYQGNATQMNVAIGPENRQVAENDPGQAVFGTVATTPPALVEGSINNVFQAISQLATDLNNNTPTSASLTDIDTAISRISTIQAAVGSKINVLTSQQSINATTILDNQTTSSAIGDVDMTSAISQLSQQQTSLQAAQQAFIKVGGMSIFQYM
jgi:flagellar hook-associated protein 3 FlgL